MTPKEGHAVLINHKIINGQPFLELTLFDKEHTFPPIVKALDHTTVTPSELETAHNLINQWLYNDN